MLTSKRISGKARSKRKNLVVKVPIRNPKQQRFLKTRFKASRRVSKQFSVPPNLRVWRRTAVQTKLKPKTNLPKLFRLDRLTGLPVDYEQTVQQVMHYVNPRLVSKPNAEQVMEELLTKMFVEVARQDCRKRMRADQLKSFLKQKYSSRQMDELEQTRREANESLSHFHSACKQGPRREPGSKLVPTYMSKFNFNQLRIKST
ncbi:uncharacterized protein LOC108091417 [Drosophila ficusphila]|uniref:uncharacterized protein LOC108091417 n=1 Tax=Drosophila ficusphila TaxID=30025 RepID=UPI0007E6AAC5|nr:uncharacterized protein LOC108091417 [Drosophila ficusphila]